MQELVHHKAEVLLEVLTAFLHEDNHQSSIVQKANQQEVIDDSSEARRLVII